MNYKIKNNINITSKVKIEKNRIVKGKETRLETQHGDKYIRLDATNIMIPLAYMKETEEEEPVDIEGNNK